MSIDEIKKVKGHRIHLFTNSYDSRDFYRHYKKLHKTSLSESEYTNIVKSIFKDLIDTKLIYFIEVKLPFGMGYLRVDEIAPTIINEDGVYKCKGAVDWKSTLSLWDKDDKARKDKILIFTNTSKQTVLRYIKANPGFKFQKYFDLKPRREVKSYIFNKIVLNDNYNL